MNQQGAQKKRTGAKPLARRGPVAAGATTASIAVTATGPTATGPTAKGRKRKRPPTRKRSRVVDDDNDHDNDSGDEDDDDVTDRAEAAKKRRRPTRLRPEHPPAAKAEDPRAAKRRLKQEAKYAELQRNLFASLKNGPSIAQICGDVPKPSPPPAAATAATAPAVAAVAAPSSSSSSSSSSSASLSSSSVLATTKIKANRPASPVASEDLAVTPRAAKRRRSSATTHQGPAPLPALVVDHAHKLSPPSRHASQLSSDRVAPATSAGDTRTETLSALAATTIMNHDPVSSSSSGSHCADGQLSQEPGLSQRLGPMVHKPEHANAAVLFGQHSLPCPVQLRVRALDSTTQVVHDLQVTLMGDCLFPDQSMTSGGPAIASGSAVARSVDCGEPVEAVEAFEKWFVSALADATYSADKDATLRRVASIGQTSCTTDNGRADGAYRSDRAAAANNDVLVHPQMVRVLEFFLTSARRPHHVTSVIVEPATTAAASPGAAARCIARHVMDLERWTVLTVWNPDMATETRRLRRKCCFRRASEGKC